MSIRQVVERKERSMAELLMIVVLIGVMSSVFMNLFFKQEKHLNRTAFETLIQAFSAKVNVVHAQWMMDQQPNNVALMTLGESNIRIIPVNTAGWVDVENSTTPCHDIWRLVMDIPLSFMNEPVGVIEITRSNQAQNRVCRYSINNDLFFEYHSHNGRVAMQ